MVEQTLTFPAKPEYVGQVRRAIEKFLRSAGVQSETISDMQAAASEACANIVRYAYAEAGGVMDVRFEFAAPLITVTVTDYGQGFDAANPPQRPIKDTDIHLGMGLKLMRGLTDEVRVKSGAQGTAVTLIKKI